VKFYRVANNKLSWEKEVSDMLSVYKSTNGYHDHMIRQTYEGDPKWEWFVNDKFQGAGSSKKELAESAEEYERFN
jgi:hypothetical protein